MVIFEGRSFHRCSSEWMVGYTEI